MKSCDPPEDRSQLISYYRLRQLIGIVTFCLPFELAIGGWIFPPPDWPPEISTSNIVTNTVVSARQVKPPTLAQRWKQFCRWIHLQETISQYYYTPQRDIFVGTLFAIGTFLICYQGLDCTDRVATLSAGILAFGIAILPTHPKHETDLERFIAYLHLVFATLFFLILAFISFFQFTRTKAGGTMTIQKIRRNFVYRVCAILIVTSVVCVGLISRLPDDSACNTAQPVFVLESIAICSFGLSWLTKGEILPLMSDECPAPILNASPNSLPAQSSA